jgi:hypothetical protein
VSLAFWQRKPATGPGSWEAYWDTLRAPHRDAIVQAFRELPAFDSVLEVGAGPGVNLWRLLEAFPDVDLTGLDVSDAAVDDGTRRFAAAMEAGTLPGAGRVALCAGVLPEALQAMEAVDVVLACYALAYVPPADIQATIQQLLTLARRAVVILEPMMVPGVPVGRIPNVGASKRPVEYRYDYLGWFSLLSKGWRVTQYKPVVVDRMNRLLVAERLVRLP